MGMSITVHVYDRKKVEHNIEQKFGSNSAAVLKKAMGDFGVLTKDVFVLQSADYWDDYCPWSQYIKLIECINNKVDGYDLLDKCQIGWKYQGANAADYYYDKTEKELPCHPDDDWCGDEDCDACKNKEDYEKS
jgi:hypothetical protein